MRKNIEQETGRALDQPFGDECPMPEPLRARLGAILSITGLFYLGFVTRVMFGPLMPVIEKDLAISHAQAGTLYLMMSLGLLIAPLCSGLVSSKWNHRGTLAVSAWAVGLVLLPFFFVNSLWAARFLILLIGLSAGIHLPSAIATITAEIRKADWGKALSVHQSAPPLAFVTAPLIAVLMLNWLSWRAIMAGMGVAALVSAAAFSLAATGGNFPGQLPSPKNVRQVLSRPSFYLMVLLFAMAMGGNAGIYAMLPLFLVTERGMELTWANTLIGLSQLSGLFMVFVAGWLTDRFGQKATMAVILLVAGAATILMGVVTGRLLVFVIFVQPALVSSFFPGAFAALSRIAPPALRSVTSALGPPCAFLIGGGLLPVLIGWFGETHTFAAGIVLAGVFMLFGPILVLFLKLGLYDNQAGC